MKSVNRTLTPRWDMLKMDNRGTETHGSRDYTRTVSSRFVMPKIFRRKIYTVKNSAVILQ